MSIRRIPVQRACGSGGASVARLLWPPRLASSFRKSLRRGGCGGNGFFFTTRHTDFHSLASNTASHGRFGETRFKDVRDRIRAAMIL